MNKDAATTIAGGSAGLMLLLSVQWSAVPYGECVKIGVAIILALVGYLMYREPKGGGNGPSTPAAA